MHPILSHAAFVFTGMASMAAYSAVLLCSGSLFPASEFPERAFTYYSFCLGIGTILSLIFAFDPYWSYNIGIIGSTFFAGAMFTASKFYGESDQPSVRSLCLNIGYSAITGIGLSSAVPQSAAYALGNLFPSSFVGSVAVGQGASGVIIFLASESFKYQGFDDTKAVFIISILMCFLGYLCVVFTFKTSDGAFYYNLFKTKRESAAIEDAEDLGESLCPSQEGTKTGKSNFQEILGVARKVTIPGLTMFFILLGCFSAVPGPIMQVVDKNQEKLIIGIFQATDLLGRCLGDAFPVDLLKLNLYLAILRAILIPPALKLLCLYRHQSSNLLPVIFIFYVGLSRGYQGTLATIGVNSKGKDYPVHATNLLTCAVIVGTSSGSSMCSLFYKSGFYPHFYLKRHSL
eukprot:GHVP01011597.1.p1 GENE.GHVP01011597.1~~GHVP01011597.1.p1  ORF type:complete len:402 (+),score=46.41 GHVP01011597.1:154-1359(+)